MTKEEIIHLGELSRISLTVEEIPVLQTEIAAILSYVSAVSAMVEGQASVPEVGAVFNVFRDDVVTNIPGSYTEVLTAAFPKKVGPYLEVKKILNQSE